MKIPNHIIITPSYSGKIEHGYKCLSVSGISSVQLARHTVLAGALSLYPTLPQLWLDDDVKMIEKDIVELFDVQALTGAGVVSGWYPFRISTPIKDNHAEKLINNIKPGEYHGRWSELSACAAGCMLVMPWVWQLFDKKSWLWLDHTDNEFGELSCPPAFMNYHTWDHMATTEDYDFCLNVRKFGVKIVSANNVSVMHDGRRIAVNVLNSVLKSEKIPDIEWVNNLSKATQSNADIVIIGDEKQSKELIKDIQKWCVDLGHPIASPRFLKAVYKNYEITTPQLAKYIYFGIKTHKNIITYPEAKVIS